MTQTSDSPQLRVAPHLDPWRPYAAPSTRGFNMHTVSRGHTNTVYIRGPWLCVIVRQLPDTPTRA